MLTDPLSKQIDLEGDYVMNTFARLPLQIVEGRDMYVFDSEGNTYVDFVGGIGCISVGHCRKEVSDAVIDQCRRLVHVSNYYYVQHRGQVAETLSRLLGEEGDSWKSFFVNSGAEANECAIKLARLYARKKTLCRLGLEESNADHVSYPSAILTVEGSFHGRSLATLAATAQPAKQKQFEPLPKPFLSVPSNDIDSLERIFEEHGDNICAVMFECIQGEAGVRPLSVAFLQALEELAHTHDALLIVDEVQTGLFRCSKPFSFQISGIRPDIVTIAKGVANGLPMGMCCARGVIADAFRPGDNGTTFGGGPVAMVAARQTLELLQNPTLASHIESTGRYLRAALAELPFVEEVRGKGLMVAAKVTPGLSAKQLVRDALDHGVLLNATDDETLRFLPPLICEKAHIDVLAQALRATVKKIRESEAN